MQQQKSAIDKLLDQEFARREPTMLDFVADVGLWGISTIDEGASGFRERVWRMVNIVSERSSSALRKAGDWLNDVLDLVDTAEMYSHEKARSLGRLFRKGA